MPLTTTPEFQAVILASISDGDTLAPMTNTLPLALLPVANRPLISYQLELLARSHSFKQVLVLTTDRWLPQLSTWVTESYKGPLQVELLVVPDEAGSAQALHHIKAHLVTDFVVLAGDVITDLPFQRMADLHRLQGAGVTALFHESAPREAGVAKKAKDLDGIDFVGIDERGQRLLSLEAAADCEDNTITVSQSLLRAYPHVTLRTDLVDAHVYIFARWALEVLGLKEHFVSAKFELLPYLVRKQFLPKANLATARRDSASRVAKLTAQTKAGGAGAAGASADVAAGGGGGGDLAAGAAAGDDLSAFAMATGEATRRQLEHADDFRCCCYIMAHDSAYCLRTTSVKE